METTRDARVKTEEGKSPLARYIKGLAMAAARVVAVLLILPLLMWKAAQAYGHKTEAADQAASAASLKATVAGGGMLSIGGLAANDIAIVGGLLLGVAGFLLQWYYQRRRDRREEREHQARMSELKDDE